MENQSQEDLHLPSRERLDIKSLVQAAFANRIIEQPLEIRKESDWSDPIVEQVFTQSDIEIGQRTNVILSSGEGDEVIELPFTPKPNEVYTEKIQDYHWLLRYAAEICLDHVGKPLTPDVRRKLLKKDLAHEFQHALKGKGEDGLVIKYAVSFSESPDGKSVSWQPSIILTGRARRKTIQAIAEGTSWRSKSDEIATKGVK